MNLYVGKVRLTGNPLRWIAIYCVVAILSACNFSTKGPEAIAIEQVKLLIEQPEIPRKYDKYFSPLPNRVVLEYLRALYIQGVKLKYQAEESSPPIEGPKQITVTIIPVSNRPTIYQSKHVLIVELIEDDKEAWQVKDLQVKN